MPDTLMVSDERIERSILLIRGRKVMLDADLAELYGVPTKRLNEQVRRNIGRFPKDFMFQLDEKEIVAMRSQIATASDSGENIRSQIATASKRNVRYLPYAFTEQDRVQGGVKEEGICPVSGADPSFFLFAPTPIFSATPASCVRFVA